MSCGASALAAAPQLQFEVLKPATANTERKQLRARLPQQQEVPLAGVGAVGTLPRPPTIQDPLAPSKVLHQLSRAFQAPCAAGRSIFRLTEPPACLRVLLPTRSRALGLSTRPCWPAGTARKPSLGGWHTAAARGAASAVRSPSWWVQAHERSSPDLPQPSGCCQKAAEAVAESGAHLWSWVLRAGGGREGPCNAFSWPLRVATPLSFSFRKSQCGSSLWRACARTELSNPGRGTDSDRTCNPSRQNPMLSHG